MVEFVRAPLHPNDAFLWILESDPHLRSTTLGIALLDCSPDWPEFVARTERTTRLIPTMRQRIAEPPTRLTPLVWADDPDFDIGYHLRRVQAPPPATFATVVDLARTSAMAGFDRARPLWETIVVDGLEDGRAALVTKLHHVLADGIGAMQLASLVFDLERHPPPVTPLGATPPPTPMNDVDVLRASLGQETKELVDFASSHAASAMPALLHAVAHPRCTIGDAVATARSIWHTVEPVTETLSPIMTSRSIVWRFHTLDVPLGDLHGAARRHGFTVNDGFLAGIAGGMCRYHERHSTPVDELRVAMPISLRRAEDPPGGNHVTLMRFKAPINSMDPVERMRKLHELVDRARHERSLPFTNAIAGTLNLLPSSVVGSMIKHVDFLASNVPGLTVPVYVGGAEVLCYYPFGPTLGSAVNITLLSYLDTCCIGINCDARAIPDDEEFVQCIAAGLDEVIATPG
jgi:WS/DGAT/MGAT family acyltransferase